MITLESVMKGTYLPLGKLEYRKLRLIFITQNGNFILNNIGGGLDYISFASSQYMHGSTVCITVNHASTIMKVWLEKVNGVRPLDIELKSTIAVYLESYDLDDDNPFKLYWNVKELDVFQGTKSVSLK